MKSQSSCDSCSLKIFNSFLQSTVFYSLDLVVLYYVCILLIYNYFCNPCAKLFYIFLNVWTWFLEQPYIDPSLKSYQFCLNIHLFHEDFGTTHLFYAVMPCMKLFALYIYCEWIQAAVLVLMMILNKPQKLLSKYV